MSAFSIENRKVLGPNAESFDDDQLLKKMTAYAKKHFDGIKEGDVVSIEYETGYRNEGVFIWNGKKVVKLYTKLDDYGSVPPEIEISDDNNLDAYSWEGLIDHNKLVWYSPEIRDRIKNNLNDDYTAQVDIRGKTWNFILHKHDIHDEETGTEHTVEQLKKALPKNIIAFDTAEDEDHSNNVYMSFTYDRDGKPLINGKPRRPKQNDVNKTKRVSSKENASPKSTTRRLKIKNVLQPHVEPLQVDHQDMQIVIARVEAELAAARENVAQLERQLTAVHLDVLNLNR